MRIKLDENLPASLVHALVAMGHDVDTVPAEGLRGQQDPQIWNAAQAAGRFLITQDLDFSDIRAFEPGRHEGMLLLRLREATRLHLFARVQAIFGTEDVESWRGCFVVATDHKVRIRRPRQRD